MEIFLLKTNGYRYKLKRIYYTARSRDVVKEEADARTLRR